MRKAEKNDTFDAFCGNILDSKNDGCYIENSIIRQKAENKGIFAEKIT